MSILTFTGNALMVIGSVFLFLGALGIFRMPDVYTRMQAGTKATTLGALSLIVGVGLVHPAYLTKTLVIAIFIAISNPISSHALARGSHRAGIKPFSKSGYDAYAKANTESEDQV